MHMQLWHPACLHHRCGCILTATHVPLLQDLFVGAHIEVYSRAFELTDADEYTLTYMENNKHIFIMADADALIKTTKAQIR